MKTQFRKICDTQVDFPLKHGAWVTLELTDSHLLLKTYYQDGEHGVRCIGIERISYKEFQGGYGEEIMSTYNGQCSGNCSSCRSK